MTVRILNKQMRFYYKDGWSYKLMQKLLLRGEVTVSGAGTEDEFYYVFGDSWFDKDRLRAHITTIFCPDEKITFKRLYDSYEYQ